MPLSPGTPALYLGLAAALALLGLVAALNWLLYRHAFAMTHFVRRSPVQPPAGRLEQALCGPSLERVESPETPADVGLGYENHTVMGANGRLAAWHVPHPWRRGLVLLFHGYHSCKARLL